MKFFIPLFIIIPALELMLLIYSWLHIGFLPTFFLIVITGVLGAYLTKTQIQKIWKQLRVELSSGMMPGNTILEGIVVLIGGILLLVPGYLSDITGLLLLIPFIRRKARWLIYLWLRNQFNKGRFYFRFRR